MFRKVAILVLIGLITLTINTLFWKKSLFEKFAIYFQHSPKKRIMIIAPHPDDESLGTAGLISKMAKKSKIRVIVMTYGDSSFKAAQALAKKTSPSHQDFLNLGAARHRESLKALTYLGVNKNDIRFLGYPDGSLVYLWRNHWDYSNPRKSRSTNVDKIPYASSNKKGALFCGKSVLNTLTNEIKTFQPDVIYYPISFDRNLDHWATSAFTKYVLYNIKLDNVRQNSYLIHFGYWPKIKVRGKNKKLEPPKMLLSYAKWVSLPLTKKEIAEKDKVLGFYPTQVKFLRDFFWPFVRKNELFAIEGSISIHEKNNINTLTEKSFYKIKDPPYDTVKSLYTGSVDLTSLLIAANANKLRLILKTRENISTYTDYFIDIKILREKKPPKQIRCTIKDNKITITKVSDESIIPKIDKAKFNSASIDLTISSDVVKEARFLLISAYSLKGKIKDQTEIKVFKFH